MSTAMLQRRAAEAGHAEWVEVRPMPARRGLKLIQGPVGDLVEFEPKARLKAKRFVGDIEVL